MVSECVTLPHINSHVLSLVLIATGSILVNLFYFSHDFRFWVVSHLCRWKLRWGYSNRSVLGDVLNLSQSFCVNTLLLPVHLSQLPLLGCSP